MSDFKWTNVTGDMKIVDLLKKREEIEKQIRELDEMALVRYEFEKLALPQANDVDTRGVEIGRYLSKLKYIDTNDSRIYGTEKQEEQNILNIMKKLKDGDELPPILLDYDFGILDGHHRWEAAKRLKIKKIPVIIYENPNEL